MAGLNLGTTPAPSIVLFFAERISRGWLPDVRGYGSTDAPDAVEAYDIKILAADMVGILDALGEERAIMVGHDWGSIVAWNTVLLVRSDSRADSHERALWRQTRAVAASLLERSLCR